MFDHSNGSTLTEEKNISGYSQDICRLEGILNSARSDTLGTSSRCTVRGSAPCQNSFSTAHAYRRLQTDSARKNNIVRCVQTSRQVFFVCYKPSRQTSLSSQHESLVTRVSAAQGGFSGAGRWRARGRSSMQ